MKYTSMMNRIRFIVLFMCFFLVCFSCKNFGWVGEKGGAAFLPHPGFCCFLGWSMVEPRVRHCDP